MHRSRFLLVLLLSCTPITDPDALDPGDTTTGLTLARPAGLDLRSASYHCPAGLRYDAEYHLCVSEREALGPFTPVMVNRCRRYGGGAGCDAERWAVQFARSLRGRAFCQPGSRFDLDRLVCRTETEAYGPFTTAMVEQCRAQTGAGVSGCDRMRWNLSLAPPPDGLELPGAQIYCPAGTTYDPAARLCHDGSRALGPFSRRMVAGCLQTGGEGCDSDLWPLAQARTLRGGDSCMPGTVWDAARGGCREGAQVYGPFTRNQVAHCITYSVIDYSVCESMRWRANLLPGDRDATPTRRGAWVFRMQETSHTHASLAARLASMGVGRVFLKVADGTQRDCSSYGTCEPAVPATYRAQGVEPWAWAYHYRNDPGIQANALEWAARRGFEGFVMDIEREFNDQPEALRTLMSTFHQRRESLIAQGVIQRDFPLLVTTWGNPRRHEMRIDIIDQYADGHLPQAYIEHWGGRALEEPAWAVQQVLDEYRALGAARPVHPVVSAETSQIDANKINQFLAAAGPQSSLWRIPGGDLPDSYWSRVWNRLTWRFPGDPDSAGCVEPCGRTVVVTAQTHDGVPIYSAPASDAPEIQRAYAGARYTVNQQHQAWLRVRIADDRSGWILGAHTDLDRLD